MFEFGTLKRNVNEFGDICTSGNSDAVLQGLVNLDSIKGKESQ